MSRRRYTRQQKLEAVAEAEVNGVEQAAGKVGVPRSTLRYWMEDPEFAELRQKTREDLALGFSVLAHLAQQELARKVGSMEPRDLTILLGVATDKKLLLSGEATARTESLTSGLDPDAQRRVREWLSSLARGEADRSGTGDAMAVPGEAAPAASEG